LGLTGFIDADPVMNDLKYLSGYAPAVLTRVQQLIAEQKLGKLLLHRYPHTSCHPIKSDRALYGYVMDLKNQYLKQSTTLSKVVYDDRIDRVMQALGSHSFVSRAQGSKLKSKNEIRVSSLFKDAPLPFLRMIAVHELAHLREKQHNKAFYNLCIYMEPDYHQLEFDTRLYLTYLEFYDTLY
jgi:UTP pyrophosphatase